MNLDFDTDTIRKNKIELLDCQVDILLKSLEIYAYIYQYVCPIRKKSETLEQDLRISLVRDTYEQILEDFAISKEKQPLEKIFEKIS